MATIMTNIMYYIITGIKIIVRLIRHNYVSNSGKKVSRSEGVFIFERRYAQTAATVLIAFTYGFAIPSLFIWLFLSVAIITNFDKLLITYWNKPKPLLTDSKNQVFITLLTWAPFVLLFYSLCTVFCNADIQIRDFPILPLREYFENPMSRAWTTMAKVLLGFLVVLGAFTIIL